MKLNMKKIISLIIISILAVLMANGVMGVGADLDSYEPPQEEDCDVTVGSTDSNQLNWPGEDSPSPKLSENGVSSGNTICFV